jgi:hypothetical protein
VANGVKHRGQLPHHFGVEEANHPDAMRAEPLGSRRVVLSLIRFGVRVAVNLDAQLAGRTVEVSDEAAEEDVLAPDVDSEPMIAQLSPEARLRRGEGVTQIS